MKRLYTIGHSTAPLEGFIEKLKKYQITCIADVRSVPYSRFANEYDGVYLKNILYQYHIGYVYMGKEFGARQENEVYYNQEGKLDFNLYQQSCSFQKGVMRIERGLKKGYTIAFMCTEKDPINCHRNIMVAQYFFSRGYSIGNIMIDGSLQEQEEIEERLLDLYFPERKELSLFEFLEGKKDKSDYIKEAYYKRNMAIGCGLEMEEK